MLKPKKSVRPREHDKRESGMPGGGAGRADVVGRSGVYRVSGPQPKGDAPIIGMASWGQGARGATGYEDHGESELFFRPVTPEKCRDIMTKNPVCCHATDTATHIAGLMKAHDIGIVPVIEKRAGKRLVGVVTDRDLVVKILAEDIDPATAAVDLALTEPAVTCSPDDGYEKAVDLMEQHRIKRVVVVDDSRQVVGVITESDIALRLRDRRKTGEVVECISQPDPVLA